MEGVAELAESAFPSEGLVVTLECIGDAKAKATVAPDDAPPTFFLRVEQCGYRTSLCTSSAAERLKAAFVTLLDAKLRATVG